MKKFLLLLRLENTNRENDFYQRAIERFGGEVVTVTDDLEIEDVKNALSQVEGILLPGGDDVGRLDFYLIEYALHHHLKLLGICQGMQSMALWGSEDSLVEIGNLSHQQHEEGFVHSVLLEEGVLSSILETDKISVNSHHKQTVLNSKNFLIVGRSEDGLIEAIESKGEEFQIGVQWHPERMLEYDAFSRTLFYRFIND